MRIRCLATTAAVAVAAWSVAAAADGVTYQRLAARGDAAPDAGTGVTFDGFFPPAINANRQVVFGAALTGAGVGASNDTGLWAAGTQSFHAVMREGSQAAGTDTTFGVADFGVPPPIDAGGAVAF